jgi:SAM-dependent methyltransferase
MERPWLERFLALLPKSPSVLDIGCGSGEPIGRYLIESGCSVTGVDSSPEFISICNGRFPDHEWLMGDMRTLSLGRAFNGLIAWDSFFHLSPHAQRAMFPIYRMHSMPRAALMFTSGTSYGVSMGSYGGEPLYHASLDSDEYRTLLDLHGFDVISHVVEDPTCGRRTIWLSQRR